MGVTQHIHQGKGGKGGEQGDPLMPMASHLGNTQLLLLRTRGCEGTNCSVHVWMTCMPCADRVGAIFAILEQDLQAHAEIVKVLGAKKAA